MTPLPQPEKSLRDFSTIPQGEGGLPIDVEAFRRAPLVREPFPFVMVPRFVKSEAIPGISRDFPAIAHLGSFPLPTLSYGPAFACFMEAIRGEEFTRAVEEK